MVLVNSTKPIRHFQGVLWHLGALALLAIRTAQPVYGQDLKPLEAESVEDRLAAAEEELAYAAKAQTCNVRPPQFGKRCAGMQRF